MEGKVLFVDAFAVVRCSFLAQKSVSYLDLSTCEFTCMAKTTSTEEGYQKMNGKFNRRALYTQNLDISYKLEKMMKGDLLIEKYDSNIYRGFEVLDEMYCRGFISRITTLIESSRDKASEFRRFLRPLQMMGLSSADFPIKFSRPVRRKVCSYEEKRVYCVVSRCLFYENFQTAFLLIQNGKLRKPENENEFGNYIKASRKFRPYRERDLFADQDLTPVRKWLLLQLIDLFYGQSDSNSESAVQVLQLIWRSIPDTFLCRSEILSAFKESSQCRDACDAICAFYRNKVLFGEGGGYEKTQPRSLTHLARCAIRERLGVNMSVLGGIKILDDQIGVPEKLQSFLRLEH